VTGVGFQVFGVFALSGTGQNHERRQPFKNAFVLARLFSSTASTQLHRGTDCKRTKIATLIAIG